MSHVFIQSWRKSTLFSLALAFILAGLLPVEAYGQRLYGSIVGEVTDPSGGVIPGATVTITNTGTNLSREGVTNDTGIYRFSAVSAGTYTVKVAMPGFKQYTQTDVLVALATSTRVNVRLEVGEVTEQVTVSAQVSGLQTEESDVHSELSSSAVEELPLSNYKNYQSLINLVPGATPARFQNAVSDTPERALSTNVNGTNRNNNRTIVDGAVNVNIWLPHHTNYVPPSDTIQEVNISTNNFDAEKGLTGGASITMTTKSGTNEVHGDVFEFNELNTFRAKNFFDKTDDTKKHIRHIGGFTVGGPIQSDKLFYFGGWEFTSERVNRSGLFTVPTDALRNGDFSSITTPIFDPASGNPDGTGRTQFANNVIPQNRISPVAQQLIALLPEPNQPGTSQNFFKDATQKLERNNFDIKVDWHPSDHYHWFTKYSIMDAAVSGEPALGQAGGPCLCDGGSGLGTTRVQVLTGGVNYLGSPTFTIDAVFGFDRLDQEVRPTGFGVNFGSEVLNIPGTNGPDIRQSGKPIFSISGFTPLGDVEGWSPLFREDQSFTSALNFSWIRGNHDLRWGYNNVRFELNHWQPELGDGPRGRFNFNSGITGLNGGPSPDLFNSFGAFLLGLPSSSGKSDQFLLQRTREWQHGWYFRDRWHATPKLTVSLGLRYELFPFIIRTRGRGVERLDIGTGEVILGGVRSAATGDRIPKDVGVDVSHKTWAPRVGLAYQINDKTLVRAGYGITWDPIPLSRPLRGFFPLTIAQNFVADNSFQPFNPIDQGIPALVQPDISSGRVPLPPTAIERTVFPGNFTRGYIQSWNLFVDRELPKDFTVSVGYVGTQTVNQLADEDLNFSTPGSGNSGRALFNDPAFMGRTSYTARLNGFLSANYHALQVALNRPFTDGLMIKMAYTYSHAIDLTDDDGWASLNFNAPGFQNKNRASSGFDRRQVFQIGFLAQLPFGQGHRLASSGAAAAIFGDWQINGIVSAFSGSPFTVTASGASLNAPGNRQTADQVTGEVRKLGGKGPGQPYFDPSSFAPVTDVRFGNTDRNSQTGPAQQNVDLSLFRNFGPFGPQERFKLQVRAETFNLFNTPHFSNPVGSISSGNFLSLVNAFDDERQLRFAVKLFF
ncbi:MAG: TonB-dependent receptor domain-containing protein [Acidobacteriota bacterium]